MLKVLKYIMTLLSVAATMLVLTQVSAYSSDFRSSSESTSAASGHDEPLVTAFEQLLPPFVNNEGAGVRQIESPSNTNTRILNDNDDFRVAYTCIITHQKLVKSSVEYRLRLSHREQAGFYIYELRKLLI